MASQPSYPENGSPDMSNASSITNEDKLRKAREVMGIEEGTSTIISADDQLLATLGYRAELKREFSYFTVFGQSFGAMGIAPAIAESITFSLGSAGAPGMVWTYLAGCLLLIPVALSLGELGSSMPTAGGLYYVRLQQIVSRTEELTTCSGFQD
jgi:amino acid permease